VCHDPAAIYLANYGGNLCRDHFLEVIRKKVRKTIQKYKMINPYERVAVALSGGKDSAVLLHILDTIYTETLDLIGIHINLGIAASDYSKTSYDLAKDLCQKLERDFNSVDLNNEYQISMDRVKNRETRLSRPLCAVCGTVKRYLLNRYSLNLNCEKLATGHVLDDEVSVLFMNLINGKTEQLIRTGPHLKSENSSMITRIKPLYEISELETSAYAEFAGLETQTKDCPYSRGATTLKYKNFLQNLETQIPGIKNTFLQNFHKRLLKPLKNYYQEPEGIIKPCKSCNGPTTGEICSFCTIKKVILQEE